MLRRVPVRPAEHEAPVGPLRERRPHLLTRDHPLVSVAHRAGLHVGEVGAGVRLGVALAPDLGAGEDPGEEPALLLVGAEVDDGRSEKPLADDPDAPRALRSRVLLVEDDLLREREAAAAELLGPPDPDPPGLTQRALPGGALVEQLVLVARPTPPAHGGEVAGQALGEPNACFAAEHLVLGGEPQVHIYGRARCSIAGSVPEGWCRYDASRCTSSRPPTSCARRRARTSGTASGWRSPRSGSISSPTPPATTSGSTSIPSAAKSGPFGTTIAHGYLTLSITNSFFPELIRVPGAAMGINYGANKVRFPAPVPVGSRIRMGCEIIDVEDVAGGVQVITRNTVEVEGGDKPACVVEAISRWMFDAAS